MKPNKLVMGFLLIYALGMNTIDAQSISRAKKKGLRTKISVMEKTDVPLPGANIFLDSKIGGATDVKGDAYFDNLEEKMYSIRISYVGYETLNDSVLVTKKGMYPSLFLLNPKNIVTSQINISADTYKDLNASSSPMRALPKKTLSMINFLKGNSHTEKYYALKEDIIPVQGNALSNSADLGDMLIEIDGIQTSSQGFMGYDELFFGDNADIRINTIGMSPKDHPRGLYGALSVKTKKVSDKKMKGNVNIDPIRIQTSIAGSTGLFRFMLPDNETYYNLSLEKNISGLWNIKGIHPDKNQLIANLFSKISNNQYSLNVFISSSRLSRDDRPFSHNINQIGISLDKISPLKKSFSEEMMTSNYLKENIFFKNHVSLVNEKLNFRFKYKNVVETGDKIINYGVESYFNRYNIFFDLTNAGSHSDLNGLAIPKETKSFRIIAFPTYPFVLVEHKLSDNVLIEYGGTVVGDILNLNKGVSLGPYAGVSYSKKSFTIKGAVTRRLSDIEFDMLRTGFLPVNYYSEKYPKSDQIFASVEYKGLGLKISYANFFDQYKNIVDINPINTIYASVLDDVTDSELENLLEENGFWDAYSGNPENKEELLRNISEDRIILNRYLNAHKDRMINNRNRQVISVNAWYHPNETSFLSATLSRATEGSPFSGSSTPYAKDITFSIKGFANEKIISDKLNLSFYFNYFTGFPFTEKTADPSIASKLNIDRDVLRAFSEISPKTYNLIVRPLLASKKRFNDRYPPSFVSSISISYEFRGFPGVSDAQAGIAVQNPHLFIPGVKKNIYYMTYSRSGNKIVSRDINPILTAFIRVSF